MVCQAPVGPECLFELGGSDLLNEVVFVALILSNDVARRWLLGWEAWVALQLLVAWFMPSVLRVLARQPAAGAAHVAASPVGGPRGRAKWAESLGMPMYHAVMVLLIPAAVGYAPFSRRLSMVHLWKSLLASL